MGQKSCTTSHILSISPPVADLLRPLGVPHCLGASLDTLHLLRPQSSSVCPITCLSYADLISRIPWLKISPPEPAQIPARAPLSTATCSHKQPASLPTSNTQPTNAKTPDLTQLSTGMDMTSAWPTRYTNALSVPLPDVLLLAKTDITHTFNNGTRHRWCTAGNMYSREVSAWSFFAQEPDTVHHW
jgi:hypothetical protein